MAIFRVLILSSLLASIGLCASITESEVNGASSNNTFATAQVISSSSFTSPAPVGVFSTALNAVTIHGTGGNQDVDFYSFQAMGPLQLSITDNPFTFSTILSLYNSSGDLLAFDDTSDPIKPGSASTNDSYIGTYVLPAFGTYYVSVSNAGASVPAYPDTSSCTDFGTLTRPDGGFGGISTTGCDSTSSVFSPNSAQPTGAAALGYTLVIAQTPEPGTLGLMALGMIALFVAAKRNGLVLSAKETR